MRPVVFEPGQSAQPGQRLVADLRRRLAAEHRRRPFVASDARDAVNRARRALEDLAVTAVTFRGGRQLRGAEVDHVWLAVSAGDDGHAWVLDVAFPLFAADFVELLPRYVVGEVERTDLDRVSRGAALEERVLGRLPPATRYCGEPVWSARHADG